MHDCRAVEVYIFHNVGPESAAFWNGLELCLVPIPASSHAVFSVGRDSLSWASLSRLRAELGAVDCCARFYFLLNHFDLGREKEIEPFDSVVKTLI